MNKWIMLAYRVLQILLIEGQMKNSMSILYLIKRLEFITNIAYNLAIKKNFILILSVVITVTFYLRGNAVNF